MTNVLLKLNTLLGFLAVKGDEEGSQAREAVAKVLLRTGAIERAAECVAEGYCFWVRV